MVENFFSFGLTNCLPSITVIYMTTTIDSETGMRLRDLVGAAYVAAAQALDDVKEAWVTYALTANSLPQHGCYAWAPYVSAKASFDAAKAAFDALPRFGPIESD